MYDYLSGVFKDRKGSRILGHGKYKVRLVLARRFKKDVFDEVFVEVLPVKKPVGGAVVVDVYRKKVFRLG